MPVDGVACDVGALDCVEKAELVEEIGPTEGVEVGDKLDREGVEEEGVEDLGSDDEAILLNADDANGLLDGGRG